MYCHRAGLNTEKVVSLDTLRDQLDWPSGEIRLVRAWKDVYLINIFSHLQNIGC